MKQNMEENSQMIDYMLHDNTHQQQEHQDHHQPYVCSSNSLDDKLNFQDVMQFADFGPKLNQEAKNHEETATGIDDDPIFFLKFPVLNDHHHHQEEHEQHDEHDLMFGSTRDREGEEDEVRFVGANVEKNGLMKINKKKRARSIKTSEEVESQRMTHIAVERNRRKQMNEHLRVLRSLMPGSYVQRGDQASIIGGAIEFVRELEQLLQCLESQKRRRLYGDNVTATGASSVVPLVVDQDLQTHQPPFFPAPNLINDNLQQQLHETEEIAESKSCIADIEVKLLGFDAMIKILSRRRPGQLVKTIAALEDLQINILHTNITTIDQTVLYSFTVKVGGEARLTAEDIANSVQQIFTFIHAYDSI